MVDADAVERGFVADDALNFVGLDHGRQYVAHDERRLPAATAVRESLRGCQDAPRLSEDGPFRREPGIVVVQPAVHHAM